MYVPNTFWTRLFMSVAILQCLAALFLETYVLLTVEDNLEPEAVQVLAGHTVPMYASLFIFGFIYELVLFYDSLRLSSMIQVVGVCIYNLLLMMYAAFQPAQIRDALDRLKLSLAMGERPILDPESRVWEHIEPALVALIWLLAAGTAIMCVLAFKLHTEFAWLVYKVIHADLNMKRRVLTLQVNEALVKFGFFFLFGFLVQNIVQATNVKDYEFGLSIGGTVIVLFLAVFAIIFARSENKLGSAAIIFVYFGGVVYLIYKLIKLLKDPSSYMLCIFAFITLAILVCTIISATLVFANYGKGLKTYSTIAKEFHSRNPSDNAFSLQNTAYGVSPFMPARMSLD